MFIPIFDRKNNHVYTAEIPDKLKTYAIVSAVFFLLILLVLSAVFAAMLRRNKSPGVGRRYYKSEGAPLVDHSKFQPYN